MYRILLGVPSSGTVSWTSAHAAFLSSRKHKVSILPSCLSGPNYNACLVAALNAADDGFCDRHAQIHADLHVVEKQEICRDCHGEKCDQCDHAGIQVYERWLDVLSDEMDKYGADFISVPMAIKDAFSGATSCGVGNPNNRWNPWRRFCPNEFEKFPETFCAADIGYADKFLLHNHALCLFNMESPLWREMDASGCLKAMFNFEERIYRDGAGKWQRVQDSEDWNFSRRLWELGAKTYITSKIRTLHHGSMSFENVGDWGVWRRGDENTSSQWRDTAPLVATS